MSSEQGNPLADFVVARRDCGGVAPGGRLLLLRGVICGVAALYRQAEAARPGDDVEYADGYADGRADTLLEVMRMIAAVDSDHPGYDPGWRPVA